MEFRNLDNKITFNIITDYWKDTGTPDDIIHANQDILKNMKPYFHGQKENDVLITGNVMIGNGTILKKLTKIEGPVVIGDNCLIESSHIGPNTSIGNNSKLINCDIADSIIMVDCSINGKMKIRKSIISSNSDIKLDSNCEEKILKYNGLQFSVEEVKNKIEEIVKNER